MAEEKRGRGRPIKGEEKKKLRTLRLEPKFEQQLVNAAYWCRTSVNAIIERGSAQILAELQAKHNQGQPFPDKPEEPS